MYNSLAQVERPPSLHWNPEANRVLNHPQADLLIRDRHAFADRVDPGMRDAAAVFFMPDRAYGQSQQQARYEIASGRADDVVYMGLMNGGRPYLSDLVRFMRENSPHANIRTDTIRTSAYDGPKRVGARVVDDPKYNPQSLREGDAVVLIDDGIESGDTLSVAASWLLDRGVLVAGAEVLVNKSDNPEVAIEHIGQVGYQFVTPSDPFGIWYGFDNLGSGTNVRAIGLAMAQRKENFDAVEDTLISLGGTEGLARVSMDQIVQYNRQMN